MESKKLGMIIREYRKKLGLKVYELAKMVGVTHVWITKIEKHNDLPSIVVYMNIEKTLNLPPTLRVQYLKRNTQNLLLVNFLIHLNKWLIHYQAIPHLTYYKSLPLTSLIPLPIPDLLLLK